jgi:hypothetical protein
MRTLNYLFLFLFSTTIWGADAIFSVGPPGDPNCDFTSIQEAIDNGDFNKQIRVTNQVNTTQGIIINSQNVVALKGGYANCLDANDDVVDYDKNQYTLVSNNAGVALTIDLSTNSFRSIDIEGMEFANSDGGVDVNVIGLSEYNIDMEYVDINDNSSTGIVLVGTRLTANIDNTKIYNNTGAFFGGGLSCSRATVNIGQFTAINNNHADNGGGIIAGECDMEINAGDNQSINNLEYGIFNNTALFEGAGIRLSDTSFRGYGSENNPFSVVNNHLLAGAGVVTIGGGMYIGSGSVAQLKNARIEGNSSLFKGGGIALEDTSNVLFAPTLIMSRGENGCIYSEFCSRVQDNFLQDFTEISGAALYVDGGSTALISQTALMGNTAFDRSIFKVKSDSVLYLISDLVVNNSTSGDLIDAVARSEIYSEFSTFAENNVNNYFNMQYDNFDVQVLEVIGTIIQNGAATIVDLNNDDGNHDAQIKCSLVENNDDSGVVQNQSIIGDPGFVGNNDFSLREDSIAINSPCTVIGEFSSTRYDIIGNDRLRDAFPDLGTYESFLENVFINGFE